MENDKRLSASEKEIMEVIWSGSGGLCAREVVEEMGEKKRKYTTVATFLTRLVQKGYLDCEKHGMQNVYSAKISRDEYLARQTDDFVREMYDGSAKELIACLCREKISEADYRELLGMLDKYDKR